MGHRVLGPVPVRIRGGVNEGRRWSLASLGRGFGAGTFEPERLAAITSLLRPGECFWDLGAHRGYVSLAASRVVGPEGSVVSIEPSDENLRFLRSHLRWNGVENVRVLSTAVGDEPGEAAFGGPGSSIAYRLGEGPETVPVTTVEALVGESGVPVPSFMKIDVEGAEAAVLRGAESQLTSDLALLISVHSKELYKSSCSILERRDFRIFESVDLAERERFPGRPWIGDTDFLAVGRDRPLDDELVQSLKLFAR